MRLPFTHGFALFSLLGLSACAHSYHYRPEIEGPGAKFGGDGVIFPIPAPQPLFKMKIVSGGTQGAPASAHLPSGTKMLQVQMLFATAHPSPSAGAYLDPKEQSVIISDDVTVRPSLVHSTKKKEKIIQIMETQKKGVEIYFVLPGKIDAGELQNFSLRWKVHYANGKTEGHTTRFDRGDSVPQTTGAFPDDPSDMGLNEIGFPVGFFDAGDWWDPYY